MSDPEIRRALHRIEGKLDALTMCEGYELRGGLWRPRVEVATSYADLDRGNYATWSGFFSAPRTNPGNEVTR